MTERTHGIVSLVDAMLERRPIPEVKPEPIIEDDPDEVSELSEPLHKSQPKRVAGQVDAPHTDRGETSADQRRRSGRGKKRTDKSGDQRSSAQGKKRNRDQGARTQGQKKSGGGTSGQKKQQKAEGDRPNRRRRRRRRGGGGGGGGQGQDKSGSSSGAPPKHESP